MNPYVERSLSNKLVALFETFPIVVVTGARQVGKSTLLRHLFGEVAGSVIFDPLLDIAGAKADPELFLRTHPPPLILDEIQYAPEVVPVLKRVVDRSRKPGMYLITGSQQWEVMKSLAESLAGRAVFLHLDGFSASELAAVSSAKGSNWLESWFQDPSLAMKLKKTELPHDVYEQLWRGWLPDAQNIDLSLVPDFHEAYIRTYIERDVRLLAEIEDWRQFRRFYQLMCGLTAQEVNYSELGRDLGLSPATAKRWLSMLLATFQWFELPPFSQNTLKRISKKPKGHISDVGLACRAGVISSPQGLAGHPSWGSIFESAVVGEVKKQCGLISPRPNLYHWRSHGGAEVDLLLERDGILFPLEIKSKTNPNKLDAKGIAALRESYPRGNIGPGLILSLTETSYKVTPDVTVVPWNCRLPE